MPEVTATVTRLGADYMGSPSNIGLALLPTTSVPFSGQSAILAWGRLLGYSAVAYLTWNKARPIAYAASGAALLSLVTSLTPNVYGK